MIHSCLPNVFVFQEFFLRCCCSLTIDLVFDPLINLLLFFQSTYTKTTANFLWHECIMLQNIHLCAFCTINASHFIHWQPTHYKSRSVGDKWLPNISTISRSSFASCNKWISEFSESKILDHFSLFVFVSTIGTLHPKQADLNSSNCFISGIEQKWRYQCKCSVVMSLVLADNLYLIFPPSYFDIHHSHSLPAQTFCHLHHTHKNINKLSKIWRAKCARSRFFFSENAGVWLFSDAYNWLRWHVSAINFCSICYFNMIIIIIMELSLMALFWCTCIGYVDAHADIKQRSFHQIC